MIFFNCVPALGQQGNESLTSLPVTYYKYVTLHSCYIRTLEKAVFVNFSIKCSSACP